MEKESRIWERGKQVVAFFLLVLMLLLTIVPGVHAEENATLNIHRYDGYSRENVAERVAEEQFSASNKVILVNREKFPDAISATNISQGRYPVLYTHEKQVTDSTLKLIQSMALDEVYVLGGALSVNDSVINQLKQATSAKVTRVAGRSRYDANVSAVEENFTQANHVVIASGEVYSDALYGVSYANTMDAPVVLTNTNQLQSSTVELLKKLNVNQATIIGGTLTVTEDVINQLNQLGISHKRIAGRNRYIGSAEVALASYPSPENIVIASGEVFSDALVSAPLAQKNDAPILLVRSNRMEEVVADYIIDNLSSIQDIFIQGGHLTIEPTLLEGLFEPASNGTSDKIDIPFDMGLFNQEVLSLVNKERTRLGIEPLYYEIELQQGVDTRTLDSMSIQTLKPDHSRPDGSSWSTAFNYLGTTVFAAGENIAYNAISYKDYERLEKTPGALEKEVAQMFYNQYANSPGHYSNMIGAAYEGMAVSTMFANHDNSPYYMRGYNTMVFSYSY